MKYIVLLAVFLTYFTSYAYADRYLYVENPDPDNFIITWDYPAPNKIVTDEKGTRACWIIHTGDEIWSSPGHYPNFSVWNKVTNALVLSSQFCYFLRQSDPVCSSDVTKNTAWISPNIKADGSPAQAYRTWDCG